MFDPWLTCWNLRPDGDPILRPAAALLPVRQGDMAAILRVSWADEDRHGAALLEWWGGHGAVRVLRRDGPALLMERATGRSLAALARQDDDRACRIICAVAGQLHAGGVPDLKLIPLERWFRALPLAAAAHGGVLAQANRIATDLLSDPQDSTVLHGDLHHGNVLDFGENAWRAIDPKGLVGERAFDFVPLFTNPDLADPSHPMAEARLMQRIDTVGAAARVGRDRLIRWIIAGSALSAAWFIESGDPRAALPLRIAGRLLSA